MKKYIYNWIALGIILSLGIICSSAAQAQTPMTLEQCVNYAIENNISIKQQALNVNYMENQHVQSKLDRVPSVNGSIGESMNFGKTYDYYGDGSVINERSVTTSFGLYADVVLFNSLAKNNTIKKRNVQLQEATKDLEKAKDDISLAVASAYLQILFNKELVASSKAQLVVTKQQIEYNQKQVDAGNMAKGKLYETEALAASEELTLTNYENQLQISLLDLAQLLEITFTEGFDIVVPEIDESILAVGLLNVNDVYSKAIIERPEVASKELALQGAEYDKKIAEAQLYPNLSAFYDFGTSYNNKFVDSTRAVMNFSDQLDFRMANTVGLTLRIPIFNGYRAKTGVKNARINIENSRYELQLVKNNLRKEIQQVHANAVAAMKRFYASEKAVNSSTEAFRYVEEKFNLGIVTPLEYNDSKSKLTNAQSSFIQAKYEYIFKVKILDFYNGKQITL